MNTDLVIAIVIFLITYAFIVTEKIHRTVIALLGAGLLIILLPEFTQEKAFAAIDLNVIFLLMGMMIIAHILSETGVFQWLAIKAVHVGRGSSLRILIFLSLVTAVTSALLDNVTVVVLIAPVTLFVAQTLGVNVVPFLIAEILASNIGGTATLIGDPPNILVGSAANIDFLTFLLNAGPFVLLGLVVFVLMAPFLFGKKLGAVQAVSEDMPGLSEEGLISDPVLLSQSLVVLALVFVGFLLHEALDIGTATVAIVGAALLLLWTRREPEDALESVEWATLIFFVGLFILVEALVDVGAIAILANRLLALTGGNLRTTTIALLWLSSLTSGVVDNIPYTATMIPLIKDLGDSGMNTWPLWWALVFGADMGGNATLVGASANVVVASIAARAGRPISFSRFLGYGVAVTFAMTLLATAYLWVRYLM